MREMESEARASTIFIAFSPPNGGTSSCSDLSTVMYSAGSTSVRVESTC